MTRFRFASILFVCLLASMVVAQVQEEEIPSDDPVIEQRLANLSKQLRCLQCQNQTLADSPAGLAVLFRYIKQRRDLIAEQPLSSEERRRAEDLLRTGSGKETV